MNVCGCSASPQNIPGSRRFETSVLALPSTICNNGCRKTRFSMLRTSSLSPRYKLAATHAAPINQESATGRPHPPASSRPRSGSHSAADPLWTSWIADAAQSRGALPSASGSGTSRSEDDPRSGCWPPASWCPRRCPPFCCSDPSIRPTSCHCHRLHRRLLRRRLHLRCHCHLKKEDSNKIFIIFQDIKNAIQTQICLI